MYIKQTINKKILCKKNDIFVILADIFYGTFL